MVVKLVEKMGCFGEKWRKKMVMKMVLWLLLLLEWRSRWKGEWWRKWWKKLVVEEMENEGVAGQRLGAVFLWVLDVGCWKKKEKGMKERRNKRGCVYKGGKIITILPSIQNKETHKWRLASPFNEALVWATKAGRGDYCCVQKGKTQDRVREETKRHG